MPPEPATSTTSRQHKDEKFFLVIVIALALVAGVGSWFAAAALSHHDRLHGILPEKERLLGEFSLTDETGRTVTRAELDGKILVVSFLFTSCSLTCPEVTRRMAEIQRLTANDADVRLVSLTVDPRSDTPPVLAKWGARFGADTNRWLFLTGEKTVLHGLIAKSFLAQDNGDPFNSMPGNFTGTERIAVVDRHGRTRNYFDGLRAETPAAVVAEIARLQGEH
jgi:cytochrome oxidase Cu insertion factor (SCO1/SenC/PrrC family)